MEEVLIKIDTCTIKLEINKYSFTFGIFYTCKLFHSIFLSEFLKLLKFLNNFIWYAKEFLTFAPKYLKLFVLNFIWFDFRIWRFSLWFSGVGRFVIFSLKLHKKCPYSELFWSAFFSHFPAFGLNTERYSVSLRIQSECGKIRENADQNNSEYGHFMQWKSLKISIHKVR